MPSEAEIEAAARAMFVNYNPGSDPEKDIGEPGAPMAAWRMFEDNARVGLEAAEKVRPQTRVLSVSCACGRETTVTSEHEIVGDHPVIAAARRWRRAFNHGAHEEQTLQEQCLLDELVKIDG